MAEKTKKYQRPVHTSGFQDQELKSTLEEYLSSEPKPNHSVWGFSTIAGLSLVFVAMSYLTQNILSTTLGLEVGPNLSSLIQILPYVGGAVLAVTGLGIPFRRRSRKEKMRDSKNRNTNRNSRSGSESEFQSADTERDRLDDFLYKKGDKNQFDAGKASTDRYAFSQNKKLFRSRENKKIAGVCAGLARYFDISPTMVRLIFMIATLLGYGSFILVYIAMMIVVPKEPADHFNF